MIHSNTLYYKNIQSTSRTLRTGKAKNVVQKKVYTSITGNKKTNKITKEVTTIVLNITHRIQYKYSKSMKCHMEEKMDGLPKW